MHTSGFWLSFRPEVMLDMTNQEREQTLLGLANLYQNLAPLFLMCDTRDIRVVPQVKAVETELPSIFVYDSYPGGTGLAEGLFRVNDEVLRAGMALASQCGCRGGCPSCVGPPQLVGEKTRDMVVRLLARCLG